MTEYRGPWTAPSAGVYGADGLLICSFGGRDVVKAYRKRGDTNGAMLAKYAQAAAAAPELLDALKLALDFIRASCLGSTDEFEAELIARVEAAIAKAEPK